jgi:hypothetical protein
VCFSASRRRGAGVSISPLRLYSDSHQSCVYALLIFAWSFTRQDKVLQDLRDYEKNLRAFWLVGFTGWR